MAIDQQTYQRWWNLHLRVARGDKLDSADQAFYESVRQQLEGEETLRAPAPELGALQAVIKSLESEHSGLEARSPATGDRNRRAGERIEQIDRTTAARWELTPWHIRVTRLSDSATVRTADTAA